MTVTARGAITLHILFVRSPVQPVPGVALDTAEKLLMPPRDPTNANGTITLLCRKDTNRFASQNIAPPMRLFSYGSLRSEVQIRRRPRFSLLLRIVIC